MVDESNRFSDFNDIINSIDQIRDTVGEPPPPVLAKVIDRLDDACRGIIEKSPFIVVGSANSAGYPDISPKGDPADISEAMVVHANLNMSPEELESRAEAEGVTKLY